MCPELFSAESIEPFPCSDPYSTQQAPYPGKPSHVRPKAPTSSPGHVLDHDVEMWASPSLCMENKFSLSSSSITVVFSVAMKKLTQKIKLNKSSEEDHRSHVVG